MQKSSLFSCIFLLGGYFKYTFILLDNSIVSRLLRMYDTDLKRRAVELTYGSNLDGSKKDSTTPTGIGRSAKLLGTRNQSSVIKG